MRENQTVSPSPRISEQLERVWSELNSHTPPALPVGDATYSTYDELLHLVQTSDNVALSCVDAAQHGSHGAATTILMALLPRLSYYARRYRETFDDLVAAAWIQIMDHPLSRQRAVLTNLSLDSLKRVKHNHQYRRHEIPTSEYTWEQPTVESHDLIHISPILGLAEAQGWITTESAEVMRSVYHEGLTGHETADLYHTTPDMVRYRCHSGVKKLRNHAAEILAFL